MIDPTFQVCPQWLLWGILHTELLPPVQESQAKFLLRHKVLTKAERALVKALPPEILDFRDPENVVDWDIMLRSPEDQEYARRVAAGEPTEPDEPEQVDEWTAPDATEERCEEADEEVDEEADQGESEAGETAPPETGQPAFYEDHGLEMA